MATKREIQLYGDLIYQYRPTIRTLIANFLMQKLKKDSKFRKPVDIGNKKLEDILAESKEAEAVQQVMPNYFALVVDDTVEELIVVNDYIASLLSNENAQIVPFDYSETPVSIGDKYIDNAFVLGDNDAE